MAVRYISIPGAAGFKRYDRNIESLAGTPEQRKVNALAIKRQVISIVSQLGGALVEDYTEEDAGAEDEFVGFDYFDLTIDFPSVKAAKQATSEVMDRLGAYGVAIGLAEEDRSLSAWICIVDNQDASTTTSIHSHVDDVCKRSEAELLKSDKIKFRRGGPWEFQYQYCFNSEDDIEAAITELRKLWSIDQLHFGGMVLSERLPEELELMKDNGERDGEPDSLLGDEADDDEDDGEYE